MKIENDFILWLLGINEDNPLPLETDYVYFCLHNENEQSFISFGADEFEQKICLNFSYQPLEAEYFNACFYDKNFSLLSLRRLIEKTLQNVNVSKIFASKKIFIAIFGSNEKYFIPQDDAQTCERIES